MKQYLSIKEKYKDAILLFRLGDFYEMFMEDAEKASKILNIVLTSRNNIPMCGIPYHAAENYIKRLLEAGCKVAICEQTEDPATARGIVKREVVRVITPGTFIEAEETELDEDYVVCLYPDKNRWAVAGVSVSTGKVIAFEDKKERVIELIQRLKPKTLLIPENRAELKKLFPSSFCELCDDWLYHDTAREYITAYLSRPPESLGIGEMKKAQIALGVLVYYLKEIQMCELNHIKKVEILHSKEHMYLDPSTIRHLELVENLKGKKENTLFSTIDRTLTPMGKRTLKENILSPFKDPNKIKERLDAVQDMLDKGLHLKLTEKLKGISDLERITSRISSKVAKPREFVSLKEGLKRIPEIKEILSSSESKLLARIKDELDGLKEVTLLIEKAIYDEPDADHIIKKGFSRELDELREIMENSDRWLKEYEEKEKALTGIPSLKVGYNKVFGYYIEVTKAHLKKVPPHYTRKQTLVGGERFITPELKKAEEKILNAKANIEELEKRILEEIRQKVLTHTEKIQKNATLLGLVDLLNSFAVLAREKRLIKPRIAEDGKIVIKGGKHPVVESILQERFVPNDTVLAPESPIHIITGPNMSGKSTYIRQVALITLMAQMGSFVPAKSAVISPVDKIMTRIGTADNLAQGQSTFMVEMMETANIMSNATSNSLIILDEIGRGTSTYDGVAIAWASVEYIKDRIKAKTLFATHYHELTRLADIHPEIKNYHVEVKEWKDRIIFTHRVRPGRTDRSYGIYVAEIAGLPQEVISRAKEILAELEKEKDTSSLPLTEHPALVRLKRLRIDKLTPMEAIMVLEELTELARKEPSGL